MPQSDEPPASPGRDLGRLAIPPTRRRPPRAGLWIKLLLVVLIVGGAIAFILWKQPRGSRIMRAGSDGPTRKGEPSTFYSSTTVENIPNPPPPPPVNDKACLTVSGYIIARERIEISPRIVNVIKWMGIKKGDRVKKEQVIVRLDDAEYKGKIEELKAQLNAAKARAEITQRNFQRIQALQIKNIETQQKLDEAQLDRDMALAQIDVIQASLKLAEVYLDWCTVRSPIDGIVLEKLAKEGELVSPQTFGGSRGPSTSLAAVADLNDLQVEIDVNESDVAKIRIGQSCEVTPEAFPDHHYSGSVAEISPEANRQKGTLQVKVQILNPDQFLTPELTARVDFLKLKP
jgi:HlyD family secretion protein